jgi:hypothetical protein
MFQIKNKYLRHFILCYKLQLQRGAQSWSHAKHARKVDTRKLTMLSTEQHR